MDPDVSDNDDKQVTEKEEVVRLGQDARKVCDVFGNGTFSKFNCLYQKDGLRRRPSERKYEEFLTETEEWHTHNQDASSSWTNLFPKLLIVFVLLTTLFLPLLFFSPTFNSSAPSDGFQSDDILGCSTSGVTALGSVTITIVGCVNIPWARSCVLLMLFTTATLSASLALALWWSVSQKDVSGGFTIGAYVLAAAGLPIAVGGSVHGQSWKQDSCSA